LTKWLSDVRSMVCRGRGSSGRHLASHVADLRSACGVHVPPRSLMLTLSLQAAPMGTQTVALNVLNVKPLGSPIIFAAKTASRPVVRSGCKHRRTSVLTRCGRACSQARPSDSGPATAWCACNACEQNSAVLILVVAEGIFNPFPKFNFSGDLRPHYPLSDKREIPPHIVKPDWWQDGALR